MKTRVHPLLLGGLACAGLVASIAAACTGTTGEAAGAQCFTALDCAAGLVCVPKAPKSTTYVCSSDLTLVETEIDGGVDAMSFDAGPVPHPDVGVVPTSDGSPPPDVSTQPPDTGSPVDTGAPPKDTGAPVDTGTAVDTGSPADTGSPVDTGAPADTGSTATDAKTD